jgi:hypothetical protein
MSEETIQQTFNVSTPAQVRVSNIAGSVQVLPGEASVVEVLAVKRPRGGDMEHTQVILSQDEDGTVRVETRYDHSILGLFGWKPCEVDYTIRVPRQCDVKVSTVSSSSLVSRIEGKIEVSTVSGPIEAHDLSGALRLDSVSGKVSGERLAGPLQLKTVSGRVRLGASNLEGVEASTVSGDLELETPLGGGPYRFDAVSGNLHLTLPAENRCSVRISSISGGIHSSMPVTKEQGNGFGHGNRDRYVEFNGGGARIDYHSVSGSVWINSNLPQAEGSTPSEESHSSTMEILEKIERGDMTVEEGLQKLK